MREDVPSRKFCKPFGIIYHPSGRVVATAANLETLYAISQSFSQLQARNIEVVQSAVNRLETRGFLKPLLPSDPIFILSGEKLD